ncbi:MAG: hypothetical protein JW969_04005 [Spirochaetales bacterium]|nr:hypothetical protein [Spirochaetales bacterium]
MKWFLASLFWLQIITASAQIFDGTLDKNDILEGKYYIDIYKIELTGGQKYTIRAQSGDFDPHLSIYLPGGTVLGGKELTYSFITKSGILEKNPFPDTSIQELEKQAIFSVQTGLAQLDLFIPKTMVLLVCVSSRVPGIFGKYVLSTGEQTQKVRRIKEFPKPVSPAPSTIKPGVLTSAELKAINKSTFDITWYKLTVRSQFVYKTDLTAYGFSPLLYIQTEAGKKFEISGLNQLAYYTGASMTGNVTIGISGFNPTAGTKYSLMISELTPGTLEEGRKITGNAYLKSADQDGFISKWYRMSNPGNKTYLFTLECNKSNTQLSTPFSDSKLTQNMTSLIWPSDEGTPCFIRIRIGQFQDKAAFSFRADPYTGGKTVLLGTETLNGSLTFGDDLDARGYYDTYQLKGTAGGLYALDLSSGIAVHLDSLTSGVKHTTVSNDSRNPSILVQLPSSGLAEITVNAIKQETGGYGLHVIPLAILSAGTAQAASWAAGDRQLDSRYIDYFTIWIQAGQSYSCLLKPDSRANSGMLYLTLPDGSGISTREGGLDNEAYTVFSSRQAGFIKIGARTIEAGGGSYHITLSPFTKTPQPVTPGVLIRNTLSHDDDVIDQELVEWYSMTAEAGKEYKLILFSQRIICLVPCFTTNEFELVADMKETDFDYGTYFKYKYGAVWDSYSLCRFVSATGGTIRFGIRERDYLDGPLDYCFVAAPSTAAAEHVSIDSSGRGFDAELTFTDETWGDYFIDRYEVPVTAGIKYFFSTIDSADSGMVMDILNPDGSTFHVDRPRGEGGGIEFTPTVSGSAKVSITKNEFQSFDYTAYFEIYRE